MAQNDKGVSDLDVFEGLGKKGASVRPPTPSGRSVPPPPPSMSRVPDGAKKTMLGLQAPVMPPPAPSSRTLPPPPGPSSRTPPPPPPGRSSLPPVVAPPKSSTPPMPAPAAAKVHAAPATPGVGVEVDWGDDDDEDEATHIFDDVHHEKLSAAALAGPAPKHALAGKATLLGVPAPAPAITGLPGFGAPGSRPPPPPAPGALQARISGFPPPPGAPLPPPPGVPFAPGTQPGLGSSFPPRSSGGLPAPISSAPPRSGFTPQSFAPPRGLGSQMPQPSGVPGYFPSHPTSMDSTVVRQPSSRTGLWIVVGLAVAAVLAVAVVFFGAPHTGQIVVNVDDPKGAPVSRVDIFVDGRKQCDTAPCLVDQVAAGSHAVKIIADGFPTPEDQTVTVDAHKEAVATFSLGGAKGFGLKVSGNQPGVQLYVDGKAIGPLPQEVHDLTPGDHAIKIAGSDRYEAVEKHVTIDGNQLADLGNVSLKVLHGKATISLATPGAHVYLVSGSDRRELPMLPIGIDIDTTKTWSLEASKSGYQDYKQPLSFDDGQAEKSITVTLEPKSAEPRAEPRAVAYAPAPAPAPAPPPPAVAGGGEGFLNINSIPPSTCIVDGKSLGNTPRMHVAVKAGSHTVKFINADQGLTKTITVSVGAGESKPAVARLN